MAEIDSLLLRAKELKASDVHLTAAIPPKARIHGKLVSMTDEVLTPARLQELIFPILNTAAKERLDQYGEADFSYAIIGEGRFRVNVFKQRGVYAAVLRLVGTQVPPADQ